MGSQAEATEERGEGKGDSEVICHEGCSVGSVLFWWPAQYPYLYVTVLRISSERLRGYRHSLLLRLIFKVHTPITCPVGHSSSCFRVWASPFTVPSQ